MTIHPNRLKPALLAALFVSLSAVQAQARPDTRYLACAQVVAIVQSSGAIVLGTSAHVYKKYVKNHAYCNLNESLKNAYVPTIDNRRCKIGFTCIDKTMFQD